MSASSSLPSLPGAWGRALWRHVRSWWHMLHFGAVAVVLMLSPSSYDRGAAQPHRPPHLRNHLAGAALVHGADRAAQSGADPHRGGRPPLSYGLSQYALEMVVRVLVLELIPLFGGAVCRPARRRWPSIPSRADRTSAATSTPSRDVRLAAPARRAGAAGDRQRLVGGGAGRGQQRDCAGAGLHRRSTVCRPGDCPATRAPSARCSTWR